MIFLSKSAWPAYSKDNVDVTAIQAEVLLKSTIDDIANILKVTISIIYTIIKPIDKFMTAKRDYYEVLGVTKTSTHQEVKQQYRKLALKFHPDRNQYADSEEHFKEISEAYSVISNPEKKLVYDRHGHAGVNQRYSSQDIFRSSNGGGFDPNDVWGWRNRGGTLYSQGKYDEAIECYDKAIEIDPNSTVVWYNKGLALNSLGKYEQAIACYDRVIEIDPQDSDAWNNKGLALTSLNKTEEAKKCYEKSKELES